MLYKNKLRRKRINEDLAIGPNMKGRKRRSFTADANLLPGERPYYNSTNVTNSKGGISRLTTNDILFRKPTAKEVRAGISSASDIQIGQLYVLSKVLFDFGLIDKVLRTKKSVYQEGNANATEKALKVIDREFTDKFYDEDEPIETLKDKFDNSIDELEKIFGVRLDVALSPFKQWIDIFRPSPGTASQNFPKGFNGTLMKVVEKLYEGPDSLTDAYKNINSYLLQIKNSNKYPTPKDFVKELQRNQKLSALMREPVVKNIFNNALVDKNVRTVGDFVAFMKTNLKRNRVDKKEAHSMTVLHHEAAKRAGMIDLLMKKAGYEDGISNIQDMFDYMKKTDPDEYNYIKSMYNLSDEQIKSFKSYNELCDYLYSPELIEKIYSSTGISERPRSVGDYRRGQKIAVDLRTKKKKKEYIENKIENKRGRKNAKTIKEKRAEIEELLKTQQHANERCKEIGKDNDDPEMAELYRKYKEIAVKAGRKASALKVDINKRLAANPDAENEEPSKTEREKLDALDKEIRDIKLSARNDITDPNELELFDIDQDADGSLRKSREPALTEENPYKEFSFTLIVDGQDPDDVGEVLSQYLEKLLNNREVRKGYEDLINVDYEVCKAEYRLHYHKATRFIVDYPTDSYTDQVFNKKGKESAEKIINKLISVLGDKGITAHSVEDEDNPITIGKKSF